MKDAVQNLEQLFADNGAVELRLLGPSVMVGLFDDVDAMRAAVRLHDGTHSSYATLNMPEQGEVTNKLGSGSGLTDSEIVRHSRLLFDFDPVRERGTNSTDDEITEARERALGVQAYLNSWGWPEPLHGCSGNGWHLQYRIKLPNTPEHKAKLATLYKALHDRFSDDVVDFDVTTRNASRICRIYGSTNRKAPASQGRPQRRSSCYIPADWDCIAWPRFYALVDKLTAQRQPASTAPRQIQARISGDGSGDYSTLDALSWFRSHGLLHGQLSGDRYGVTCPWHSQHTSDSPPNHSDSILWPRGNSGWPTFFCHHAHCDGRGIVDVIEKLGDADRYCSKVFGGAA